MPLLFRFSSFLGGPGCLGVWYGLKGQDIPQAGREVRESNRLPKRAELIFLGNEFKAPCLSSPMRRLPHLVAIASLLMVNCSPSEDGLGKDTSVEDIYLSLLATPAVWLQVEDRLDRDWDQSHAIMVMEVNRFSRSRALVDNLFAFLEKKTKQEFGWDSKAWQNWLWAQDYEASKNYPHFKSELYKNVDPKFADYFNNGQKNTIRLDEIVWGGVFQDGIPPLRDPEMIAASQASYLGEDDIVFGIEVDGETRAYPKRILAWHEMFTDTIQGIPLAGVY